MVKSLHGIMQMDIGNADNQSLSSLSGDTDDLTEGSTNLFQRQKEFKTRQ